MNTSAVRCVKRLAVALVALVVVALAAPFLIPAGSYKAEIISRVKAATGRDLTISGPIRLTLLPHIGVHLEQIALSNPKGYSVPSMLDVQSATVHVALMPLLSGHAEVTKLVLENPTINLEVSAQGVPNWRFTPPDQVPEAPVRHSERLELISAAHAAAPERVAPASGVLGILQRIKLGDVEVEGGTLRYTNQPERKVYTLEKVGLQTAMNGPEKPFTLSGDAWFNGKMAHIGLQLNTPQLLLSGGNAALKLNLAADPVRVGMDMHVTLLAVTGDADINIPSLPALSGWISGSAAKTDNRQPLALEIKSRLTCSMAQCMGEDTALRLDDLMLNGRIGVAWQNMPRPYVTAALRADVLNLTPYLSAGQGGHAQNDTFRLVADAQAAGASAGWSEAPVNLAGLHALDANVSLAVATLMADNFRAQKVNLSALLKDGLLSLNLPSAALYDGEGKAQLTVDAREAAPSLATHVELHGVQAEQLLNDTAQFDHLSGKADFLLNASGHGNSQKAIIGSLSGDGKLSVADGAIKGIDMAQMQQGLQNILSGGGFGIGANKQTPFSALGGTFTIAQGIVQNNDLAMTSETFKMKGSGKVDLPLRYVNYRLEPALVSQSKGSKNANALSMPPVIVEGPFERVTFRPDMQALKDNLKNSAAVKNTINSVRDKIKSSGGVKNLLKNFGR